MVEVAVFWRDQSCGIVNALPLLERLRVARCSWQLKVGVEWLLVLAELGDLSPGGLHTFSVCTALCHAFGSFCEFYDVTRNSQGAPFASVPQGPNICHSAKI